MYEYTKASAPSAINRLATAVEGPVGLLTAPVVQFGPSLLNTLDDSFLVCQEKLLPYVHRVSDLADIQVLQPYMRFLAAAESSIAYHLPETTAEFEQAFKDSDNYNGKEIANMRSANLIFSISKVLKRRARACFESTPCTRAEMIRALRNAVDWSLQATTRCTAKTLEYCNNAWVEPTLRMGKHGPLSLLASFGDLEGIQWVRKRIMGMAAYSRDLMSKPLVAVGLMKPFKDLEGHEWSQKNVQGVHEIFKVKEV